MECRFAPLVGGAVLFMIAACPLPALAGDRASEWLGLESGRTADFNAIFDLESADSLSHNIDIFRHDFLDPPEELESHAPATFGAAHSWRWMIYTGGAFGLKRDGEQYHMNWAAEYFLADDLSISFEVSGIVFDQPSDSAGDAVGGNFNTILRWHCLAEETWSIFFDGGTGILLVSEEVPENGTNLNFTPQAGVGASFDVGDEGARLMAGARWHHISNARTHGADDNPGRDSLMAWVGLSFPWN